MEELTRQTQSLNDKMQLMMEQLILSKKNRFGRSSEKMSDPEQICFMEVDGTIVFFNEAEAVCDLDAPEPDDLELKIPKKKKGFFRGRPKMWMEFREIFHFESPFEKSSSPKSRFFNQCTLAHKEKISRQCNHLFKSNF